MLSGISITCFAASYAVTLMLEVLHLLFRSGVRRAIVLSFAGAGFFAHTVFLLNRAINTTASPLSSPRDWYLVAAWVLVAFYLYLTCCHAKNAFGLFLLPLVLGLLCVAAFLANPQPFSRESASRVWGIVHGASILFAIVAMLVGFSAGLMYLIHSYRLKHILTHHRGPRLPSLEWLQRTNGRALLISASMLGLGLLSGTVLNLIHRGVRVPWHDPVILSTLGVFAWLAVSAAITVLYNPAREGRKVAYLTVAGFMFLIISLGVGLFAETQHGGPSGENPGIEGPEFALDDLGLNSPVPALHAPRPTVHHPREET